MTTGRTRVNPQMNRMRGCFSRGMGCDDPPPPPPPKIASPIASSALPIRPLSFPAGYTIFSSAAICGPMPNARASGLLVFSASAALKTALTVTFSTGASPDWLVSRDVAVVFRGGTWMVRVSVSGLN